MAAMSNGYLIPRLHLVSGYYTHARPSVRLSVTLVADVNHGGRGVIRGTVKEATASGEIALMRRVRLHRKSDGMVTRETWSDASGNYQFSEIAIQAYYITSFDHTGNYNAVIKDSIVPEMMT